MTVSNEESDITETKAPREENRYLIQVAGKVLDVLFAFRHPPGHHSLSDLCHLTGQPKNQIFRCLKTLEAYGLVQAGTGGRFQLTAMINTLRALSADEDNLTEMAHSVMNDLAEATKETINLIALADDVAVVIDRRIPKRGVRLASQVGTRAPLHAGAVPKALLAYLPPERQEKILAMLPFFPKYTEHTCTDPERLRAELEQIRRQGFAVSDQDFELGASGVGAPIFNEDGQVVGGISAGGPITRVTLQRVQELAPLVQAAAAKISRRLGYLPRTGAPEPDIR